MSHENFCSTESFFFCWLFFIEKVRNRRRMGLLQCWQQDWLYLSMIQGLCLWLSANENISAWPAAEVWDGTIPDTACCSFQISVCTWLCTLREFYTQWPITKQVWRGISPHRKPEFLSQVSPVTVLVTMTFTEMFSVYNWRSGGWSRHCLPFRTAAKPTI